jgi:hypothetical protein
MKVNVKEDRAIVIDGASAATVLCPRQRRLPGRVNESVILCCS